jgi:hypothetical protein
MWRGRVKKKCSHCCEENDEILDAVVIVVAVVVPLHLEKSQQNEQGQKKDGLECR